ncbi:FAD-dependent oxidoreductase [Mucisphaera calidilacus]|uniref:tRNA 5-methylaminomethyl-2-thiouridine biosynthesis bifunctional protein MnmC n=1 Tax=Mucisphaera calidilacus TaxID=2527982 RepID=A0A518BZ98_9BACT|nr:FAD-dependent oxidoreductase [Mucisphaera calidilacus]QDU72302.1 tRNA 5-methylaminomethyl-2-thiouridine biosynthesis bifunctional protein MnmC [Mucisphaera calidilacus]
MSQALALDALILGGGVAGLWTLDELRRRGFSAVLLESDRLGRGQTVSAQGILHGGIKYTLSGMMTDSARAHRDAPAVWHRALRGEALPDLTRTRVLAESCYLWRTGSLSSIAGMVGARAGLATKPERLEAGELPEVLNRCPGEVFRVNEWIIDPVSLVRDFARQHEDAILKAEHPVFRREGENVVEVEAGPVRLSPRVVILTAGAGTQGLRDQLGLAGGSTQKRPLHMVMMRGDLPELHGHCVDGAHTRATITSGTHSEGQRVWQVGGQVSEDGVKMEAGALIEHAKREVEAVLPGIDLNGVSWASYRVDRAESATRMGLKPDSATLRREGNVLTAFPTKLVLAPYLAAQVVEELGEPRGDGRAEQAALTESAAGVDRPETACAPWDEDVSWTSL